MPVYVMLTRLSPEALHHPDSVHKLSKHVSQQIADQCPEVKWISNYAVLGGCDYLDIFDAPDTDTATKVSLLIRTLGHATTETWLATPWERFEGLAAGLKG
jgi:uncharacterized protein with GYD domain